MSSLAFVLVFFLGVNKAFLAYQTYLEKYHRVNTRLTFLAIIKFGSLVQNLVKVDDKNYLPVPSRPNTLGNTSSD
ncbi:MAG: hypothetical protein ACK4EX_08140 [Thermaurantimonas sp.]|uniref:hypothetical protein n=1 Tax=Thermaurantimonas sp. TaxID=2681568 RepID=UPI00391BEF66